MSLLTVYPLSQRKWSEDDKLRHSIACKAKDRLTLEQKIEIIELHETKSQTFLAVKFQVRAVFLFHLEGTISLLRFHSLLFVLTSKPPGLCLTNALTLYVRVRTNRHPKLPFLSCCGLQV